MWCKFFLSSNKQFQALAADATVEDPETTFMTALWKDLAAKKVSTSSGWNSARTYFCSTSGSPHPGLVLSALRGTYEVDHCVRWPRGRCWPLPPCLLLCFREFSLQVAQPGS